MFLFFITQNEFCFSTGKQNLFWVRPPLHNECSGYDNKQSDDEIPVMVELENAEYLFIAIPLGSTLARCGNTWWGPVYGLNRTKLRTYAKLNCLN